MVRTVPLGEADVVVTLLTEARGVLGAVAHRARRGTRIAIEPMHTLFVAVDERAGAELFRLRESRIDRPRTRLTSRLDAMEAAGRALRWARAMLPPHAAEPGAFATLIAFLDRLDDPEPPHVDGALAVAGLQLLEAVGWGFELSACVRCGTICPPDRSAQFDPAKGGLICRACGGAKVVLRPTERRALEEARDAGIDVADADLAALAVGWVEQALLAHDVVAPRA